MEQVEHTDTEAHTDRNTNNKVRGRCWLGTWNDFPDDWKEYFTSNTQTQEFIAQEEIGEKGGNRHIQFAVRFKEGKRFSAVREYYPGAHIEIAKNWIACKKYCGKIVTATGDKIEGGGKKIFDPLEGKELRPIQKAIVDIVNTDPDDRTIHWFYDPVGAMGKTTIARHLCMHNKDCLYLTGKAADMKYGIMFWLQKSKPLKTIIIDYTRSVENFVSYQGLEEIKNGIFYNTKYECGMVVFDYPHVIVLSNFRPDMSKLSADRWRIHDYGDDKGKEEAIVC